ncbi:MAG TPA: hypothetical protein VMW23_08805 [Sedimentisphaerales bacterium]|nr:hypothetical protein [Sedimentisphaerales bacterium]
MELQQFVTTVIKAIGKGITEGKEGDIVPGFPVLASDNYKGVEFDLGIKFTSEKIYVVDSQPKERPISSRIKFSISITQE